MQNYGRDGATSHRAVVPNLRSCHGRRDNSTRSMRLYDLFTHGVSSFCFGIPPSVLRFILAASPCVPEIQHPPLPWHCFSDSSSLPFPINTRALYLDLYRVSKKHFQRLLAETSIFGRLVYLDVKCDLSKSSDRLNLLEFLCAEPVFRDAQRLTLRLEDRTYSQPHFSFWTRLHRAFPSLVTLSVVTEHRYGAVGLLSEEVVRFERLEILHFTGAISYLRCRFPRLRHASVWRCTRTELQILTRSPHLESLLIRSPLSYHQIDVTSCLRLKLLGLPHNLLSGVVPLGLEHPVEHIWLYSSSPLRSYPLRIPQLFELLSSRAPKAYRILVELSSSDLPYRWRENNELLGLSPDSYGLYTRPVMHDDRFLVFERKQEAAGVAQEAAGVAGGVLRKVWNKIRR
jgi:hypothetical protein